MTIPEACQLVLKPVKWDMEAKFLFSIWAKPVKIAELAKKMIRLSGLEPEKDIKIQYTGLRPGENCLKNY